MASSSKPCTAFNGIANTGTSPTRTTLNGSPEVLASDDTYYIGRYTGAGTNTLSFRAGGFGFSIPSTSTIDGFEFLVERKRGNTGVGSCVDTTIQIHNGTTTVGTNKGTNTAFPTTDTNIIYGGPTDKWGLSYTPADINVSTFRVQTVTTTTVTSGTVDAQFDFIQMTVYYTDTITGKKRSVSGGVSYFAGCAFA